MTPITRESLFSYFAGKVIPLQKQGQYDFLKDLAEEVKDGGGKDFLYEIK